MHTQHNTHKNLNHTDTQTHVTPVPVAEMGPSSRGICLIKKEGVGVRCGGRKEQQERIDRLRQREGGEEREKEREQDGFFSH